MKQTDQAHTSLVDRLPAIFGRRAEAVGELLSALADEGVSPIVMNLPLRYHLSEEPNDIDLMLDHQGYERAIEILTAKGLVSLDQSPDPSQVIMWRWLPEEGFIRVHLHRHLCFWGIQFVAYDEAVSHCSFSDETHVPAEDLDYWIMLLEWYFRRKVHYRERLRQLEAATGQGEYPVDLISVSARQLAEKIQEHFRRGGAPSRFHTIGVLSRAALAQPGRLPAMIQTIRHRGRRWPFARRRGNLSS